MSVVEPGFDAFEQRYRLGATQVAWTRLVADLETPVSAMLKLARGRANSFLLESVEGGAVRGRYSMIGLAPDIVFRAHGARAEIDRRSDGGPADFRPCDEPTLAALRRLVKESRIELPDHLPPMAAGVFGYMGYDTVRLMEELGAPRPDPLGLPDAMFVRPTVMVIFDSVKDEVTVVTPVRPTAGVSAGDAHAAASDRLGEVIAGLDRHVEKSPQAEEETPGAAPVSNTDAADYRAMVARAKDYTAAGDIFQVVLSQRFSRRFPLPPFALYRALRRINPAPFLFHLDFGDFAVVGSSPEILVRARGGTVTVRPLAGTRPRGATPAEDAALGAELLADPKERAEHLMLLDLGRNDVGRVARIGTVRVTEQFQLEHYSQVMHIVSNVEGALEPGRDAVDALIAGFPAGTVSGAPKVRAMEIIDELEAEKRGIYAGCVGYFAADGDMDTCIVLRTAIVKDGRMHVQAGAGVVADSDPDSEQAECVNKARALFRAADEAVRFANAEGRRG